MNLRPALPFHFGPVQVFDAQGQPCMLLEAAPLTDPAAITTFAKAQAENERWITLKPHGHGGEGGGYVHVKVKVAKDGSAHVVHGPDELRGLRLTRLASPEELEARRAERAHAAKIKRAEDRKASERQAQSPEHAQEKLLRDHEAETRHIKLREMEEKMADLRSRLLDHASTITGDAAYDSAQARMVGDPAAYEEYKKALASRAEAVMRDAPPEPGEEGNHDELTRVAGSVGAVMASRNARQVGSALKRLRRALITDLVKDQELRSAVLGADGELDTAPLEARGVSGSPGYQRRTAQQAAEHGFTPQDAQRESEAVWQGRITDLRSRGEDERADTLVQMREDALNRARVERYIKANHPEDTVFTPRKPVTNPSAEAVVKRAAQVKEFLAVHTELEALERQRRALLGGDQGEQDAVRELDEPLSGAELDVSLSKVGPALRVKLESEINDAAKADLTRAFLDEVDSDLGDDAGAHSGKAGELIRKAMTAHIGSGAYGHLSNVALASAGHDGLDRQVVDTLGIDASAQLLAHALRRGGGDLSALRDGLARHHAEHSLRRMQEATEFARATRAAHAQIELPTVTDGTGAALTRGLIKEQRQAVQEAQKRLGTVLGEVEASAALNLALKGGANHLTVRFGDQPTATVATQLRALGLGDGDYVLARDTQTGGLHATIFRSGMDTLTQPLSPERQRQAELASSIKRGDQDEASYLPAGFMARNPDDETTTPGIPAAFQSPADFSAGVQETIHRQAAQMYADGHTPRQILTHLLDSVSRDVPSGQEAAFAAQVTSLIPFAQTEQRTAKDGTPYTAHVARDIDQDPEIHARLSSLAEAHLHEHHPGVSSFHTQRLDDDLRTRDALLRAVTEDPALQVAFSPPGDLGGSPEGRARVAAIRSYFLRKVVPERLGGLTPQAFDERQQRAQDQARHSLGEQPDKWGGGGDLFGPSSSQDPALRLNPLATPEQHAAALAGHGLRPGEHYSIEADRARLTPAGKDALRIPERPATVDGTPGGPSVIQGGLDNLNPAWVQWQAAQARITRDHPTTRDLWNAFKSQAGTTTRAYQAVQEAMQGDLITRFTHHHAQITGQQLRVSKRTGQHWETRLAASSPEKAAEIRARDARFIDELRERDASGRYAGMEGGSLASAVQAKVAKMNQQSLMMGGLGFDLGSAKGGGEVQGSSVHHLDVGPHEVPSIGRAAESQLAHILGHTNMGLKPTDGPTFTIPGLDWGAGTNHVGKQRSVKLLLQTGRLLGFHGAGSGKTAMQLGAFTQAHHEGRARKGLFVVPSIVRNQFGEEAARFTEPGRYSWHASDSSYAQRKAHYQGDTHMVVTTHQTFRDDMLRLMAEHQGVDSGQMQTRFAAQDRPGRARTLADALEHHGIPMDFLAVDEAHDFLNRAGKADSSMSQVLEAALDNSKFKSLWTGSPVKNDASEIFDWIEKIDPGRFASRDEFMRKYGVNTQASAQAMQRLMDSYSYVDSVTPDVQRTVTWGHRQPDGQQRALSLTPEQQQAYEGVHAAFERASAAQRRGQVDVQAAMTLSPQSFAQAHPSDHPAIAGRLQSALGTLRHSALGRVVNEFPAEHNAKVQHVLALAGARPGKGGVIFAHNRQSVSMLRDALEAAGHRVGVIDGRSSSDEKARVRKAFDQGEHDIVLCSDAGATGANLQARGEWLVNYDLPMTQKTLEQRNARIDRLGQRRAIELHHLATDTEYDRDNVKRLETKRELGSVLQGEFRNLEDTGIAATIIRAQAERDGDGYASAGRIHENHADVPQDVPQTALPEHPELVGAQRDSGPAPQRGSSAQA